mmetsp:Transcript_19448/g.30876  ORF Transcript_19448/g.30876 Transcript_19448/m.30876 type:complete len:634 (+) Transcript_19448:58-1959(+)
MSTAEQEYAAYCHDFGAPPDRSNHLMAYAKKKGVKVTFMEAKRVIAAKPDTSGYVPTAASSKPMTATESIAVAEQHKQAQEQQNAAKISDAKKYSQQPQSGAKKLDVKIAGMSKRSSANRYQFLLSQLTSMGWQSDAALEALKAAHGNLQLAQEALMNGSSVRAGPSWTYSHAGGASIRDKINTFSRGNGDEPHELNGGKRITKPRSQTTTAVPHALSGGKFNNGASDEKHSRFGGKFGKTFSTPESQTAAAPTNVLSGNYNPNFGAQNSGQSNTASQYQGQPHAQANGTSNEQSTDDAFEKLLSGHASIKQRLSAMDVIHGNLDGLNVTADHGKVLMSVFTEQVKHEDHIYREYEPRKKGIQMIADVFTFVLNKVPYDAIPSVIETSLAETLESLFKLLNDNRQKKFHPMAQECILKIVDAVIGKRHKTGIVSLCEILNAKINSEVMTQALPRFLAAQIMFQRLIFGQSTPLIDTLFAINIEEFWKSHAPKWQELTLDPTNDIPHDRTWLDVLTGTSFANDDDETLKDIVADSLSLMLLDPNSEICSIGTSLTVYFTQHNENFRESLETEAKYRFSKWLPPKQPQKPIPMKQQQQPPNNVRQRATTEVTGPVDYRIKQMTKVTVAAPTLPSL